MLARRWCAEPSPVVASRRLLLLLASRRNGSSRNTNHASNDFHSALHCCRGQGRAVVGKSPKGAVANGSARQWPLTARRGMNLEANAGGYRRGYRCCGSGSEGWQDGRLLRASFSAAGGGHGVDGSSGSGGGKDSEIDGAVSLDTVDGVVDGVVDVAAEGRKEVQGGSSSGGGKDDKGKSTRRKKRKKKSSTTQAAEATSSTTTDSGSGNDTGPRSDQDVEKGEELEDGGGVAGGDQRAPPVRQKKPRAPRPKSGAAFGRPLSSEPSLLREVETAAREEDELPSSVDFDVDDGRKEGEDQEEYLERLHAYDGLSRAMAVRPEIVHALCRGLPEKALRDVVESLRRYAITSSSSDAKESLDRALQSLEEKLAQLPHQAEWAVPLIRAHLEDHRKPSAESHAEQLRHVRDANTTLASPEEVAEGLLHIHASNRFYPNTNRVDFEKSYPERWTEAKDVASRMAARLPFQRYQQLVKTIRATQEKENPRKARLLTKLTKFMDKHVHLVIPALARFWRVKRGELVSEMELSEKDYLQDQELLAKLLSVARRRRQRSDVELEDGLEVEAEEDGVGPWSIEELRERDRRRLEARNSPGEPGLGMADMINMEMKNAAEESEEADQQEQHQDGDGINGKKKIREEEEEEEEVDRTERRRKFRDSPINVTSLAVPPDEIPELQRPTAPVGLFELHVTESPRELNLPPPKDIFGGDTPMGIGEAGMGELPIWDGVDADATRGMSFEDQYLWPEEKEEIERKEKDEEEAGWEGARGQAWAKGAGKLDLSLKRQADYQDVEDVLLTGRRLKRPPKVTFDDLLETMRAQAAKTRLLRRSALVAELHPDQGRLRELRLEDQGRRTVFVKDLPDGLSTADLEEAFSRCGEVEEVILKEPTFRKKKTEKLRRRYAVESPYDPYVSSTPHGFVVFKDRKGYEKATARYFSVFGVNIKGVSVTTSPGDACRTVYVENTALLTGQEFVDAINEAIQPHFEVMLMSHFLDDDMPQAVSIPLRSYAAARGVDELIRSNKMYTAFHYQVPELHESLKQPNLELFDGGLPYFQETEFLTGKGSASEGEGQEQGQGQGEGQGEKSPEQIMFDEIVAASTEGRYGKFSRTGMIWDVGGGGGKGDNGSRGGQG